MTCTSLIALWHGEVTHGSVAWRGAITHAVQICAFPDPQSNLLLRMVLFAGKYTENNKDHMVIFLSYDQRVTHGSGARDVNYIITVFRNMHHGSQIIFSTP